MDASIGVTISTGDINGDGIHDIISGSPNALSIYTGETYVVFGKRTWNSPISVASLNGTNGFLLNGTVYGFSGCAVSGAGDVNGDKIDDIIIGAYLGSPGGINEAGMTYVVFGKNTTWNNTVYLKNFDGIKGVELDGILNGRSGSSVSSAGDVNGDGIQDIIIGAPNGAGYAGIAYVVYGKLSGWNSPFLLSNLNGANGFELDGLTGDGVGASVSNEGDVNGDGVSDIIIGASGSRKVYVVFGDGLTLTNNRLTVSSGATVTLDSNALSAYDLIQDNSALVFTISDVTEGYFQSSSAHGVPIFTFAQQQVNSSEIQFVHDGSAIPPGYNVTVQANSFAFVGPVPANITFILPVPTNNPSSSPTVTASLSPTSSPTMNFISTSPTLSPTSIPSILPTVGPSLIPTSISSVLPTLSPTVASSNQPTHIPSQLTSNSISPSAVPSGSPTLFSFQPTHIPSFMSSIPSSIPTTIPSTSPVSVVPIPTLLQNTLSISNGQTVTLTAANLQAVQPGFNDSQLIFSVSNLQQGIFYKIPNNITTFNFPQSSINSGLIQFRHAGNQKVPGYSVLVSNEMTTSLPDPATIYFLGALIVQVNPISITKGGIIILTTQTLNVTSLDGSPPSQITLEIQNLQHATLSSTITNNTINNFTLSQLQAGTVQLRQDGSNYAPSFSVIAISQSGISSAAQIANIAFNSQGVMSPMLINNFLSITQGETINITTSMLQGSSSNGQALSYDAIFYLYNVQNGFFSVMDNPGVPIPFFSQAQLQQGYVQFTQDGTHNLPSYSVTLEENGLYSANSQGSVFFTPINHPPQLIQPLSVQYVTVGQPFSFTVQNSFIDPQGEAIQLSAQYQNSSFLPPWLTFDIANERFTGTAPVPGLTNIELLATDTQGLSTETNVAIDAIPTPNANASPLEKALISTGITVAVGAGFYLLKLAMKRAADKKIIEALNKGQNAFDQQVVMPIAQAISKKVKINGFLGIGERSLNEFKTAVRALITELDKLGMDTQIDKMDPKNSEALVNELGTQTKRYVLEKRSCGRALCFLFVAEVSPEEIRKAAPIIAKRVANNIGLSKDSHVIMASLSPSQGEIKAGQEDDGLDLKLKG